MIYFLMYPCRIVLDITSQLHSAIRLQWLVQRKIQEALSDVHIYHIISIIYITETNSYIRQPKSWDINTIVNYIECSINIIMILYLPFGTPNNEMRDKTVPGLIYIRSKTFWILSTINLLCLGLSISLCDNIYFDRIMWKGECIPSLIYTVIPHWSLPENRVDISSHSHQELLRDRTSVSLSTIQSPSINILCLLNISIYTHIYIYIDYLSIPRVRLSSIFLYVVIHLVTIATFFQYTWVSAIYPGNSLSNIIFQ